MAPMTKPRDSARPLGVGIIGAGFIAGVHAHAARSLGARVVGVVAGSAESSRRAAPRLGAEAAFESVERLVADDAIDVVHVCSPNGRHAEHARLALAAGKHVVCEKPVATSLADALELDRVASAAGLVGAVPFAYRYHPMVRELRSRVAAGEAGALISVRGAYLQDWRLVYRGDGWWTDRVASGPSRAFADIGSHVADLTEFVTGERIVAVSAALRQVEATSPGGRPLATEDVAAVLVRLEGGAIGTLTVSQMDLGRKNELTLQVAGVDASYEWRQETPDVLEVGRADHRAVIPRQADILSPDAARLSRVPAGHPMGYQDAFDSFVADVYATVDGDAMPGLPGFADGARMVRLTERVLESASTGAWLEV